jgi:hypothetical protein
MAANELKNQKDAFEFFREHFRKDKAFTSSDFLKHVPGWKWKSASTYWSKQFEPFLTRVPPILRGKKAQADQQWRVTDVFLIVGTWPKFRRHVSQKRRLTFEYTHAAYKTVLIFEFFLPLTNETVLRNALDALFYRDTLQKKLLALGFAALKSQFEQKPEESDSAYLDRLIAWLGKHFRGYSIGHVSGRFRADDEALTMQDAAGTQERGGRYLIDETTAVTRFIFPCENSAEAQ